MSITLRRAEESDYPTVEEIFERCHKNKPYDIPSIKHSTDEQVAVDATGRVVAFGVITTFAEGSLVLDKDVGYKDRVLAAKKLIQKSIESATDSGMERLYLIADTPEYAEVLKKHFGAQSCAGELLVIFTGD